MAKLNGKSLLLDKLAITSICTDACCIGAGGYYQDDWLYANWVVDFPFVTYYFLIRYRLLNFSLETNMSTDKSTKH
jgi:hypothetical protein